MSARRYVAERRGFRVPVLSSGPLLAVVDVEHVDPRTLPRNTGRAWERARRRERLTLAEADRLACHVAGVHPALVWGEKWWDAL